MPVRRSLVLILPGGGTLPQCYIVIYQVLVLLAVLLPTQEPLARRI